MVENRGDSARFCASPPAPGQDHRRGAEREHAGAGGDRGGAEHATFVGGRVARAARGPAVFAATRLVTTILAVFHTALSVGGPTTDEPGAHAVKPATGVAGGTGS